MKKIAFIFLPLVFTVSSCKKDWTCHIYGDIYVPGAPATPVETKLIFENKTQSDAEDACEYYYDNVLAGWAAYPGVTHTMEWEVYD